MAGGALGGVIGAALRLFPWFREDLIKTPFYASNSISQIVSAVFFIALCIYVWYGSLRRQKPDPAQI
jgi:membrane associated rhomboid family serine protease